MAYYCKECATWLQSRDVRRGYKNDVERYCEYDRAWRSSEQNIYGCRGFEYVGRSIITKVCEILGIERPDLFDNFDEIKENYLIQQKNELFIDYNVVGPVIAERLESDPQKEMIANNLLNTFMIPAAAYVKTQKYEEAVKVYERMVNMLAIFYHATKENIQQENMFKQLIKVRV